MFGRELGEFDITSAIYTPTQPWHLQNSTWHEKRALFNCNKNKLAWKVHRKHFKKDGDVRMETKAFSPPFFSFSTSAMFSVFTMVYSLTLPTTSHKHTKSQIIHPTGRQEVKTISITGWSGAGMRFWRSNHVAQACTFENRCRLGREGKSHGVNSLGLWSCEVCTWITQQTEVKWKTWMVWKSEISPI